jgi:2-dehydro-3-deoxyphosphogluconate aldolase / (4S)-4-hydroxy-2-oxoglutarate aldolase
MNTMSEIARIGVVPVIKLDDPLDAVPLAEALKAGGIPVAEVTFRTSAAEESIRRIAGEVEGVLLGAGTVLTVEQVERAHKAGAKFIVSPGFDRDVVARSLDLGMDALPGCATPTEIMAALKLGLKVVKFFPASVYGGLAGIKSLSAAFPGLGFVPTGGVGPKNLAEFLGFKPILACGGSWMVDVKNLPETTRLSAEARAIVQEVRG